MDYSARKAKATIRVLRPDGSPAAREKVRFDQISNEFLFGCGAFDAVELMKDIASEKKAFLTDRMEKWLALFNYGTLPFYWGRYEKTEGHTEEIPTMAAAKWLREKGVTVKGHPLCWHTVCADWLLKYDNEEIMRRQLERIRRDAGAFRGTIGLWDVINEVVIMPVFDRYDNAITRICKEYGQVGLVKKVFDAARETDPDAVLLINDFNTSPAYERLIEELLAADVPIGAIGIQSHQHQGYWGYDKLCDVLERFSRFGLPIHFTENSLVSGQIMPGHIVDLNDFQVPEWPSTPEGEDRQAREITEIYSTLYAHPLVRAVTNWDATDGCWLKAPTGVMRADNSVKPVYEALMEKIHGEWETHTELVTDEKGEVTLEGFRGTYRAAVKERTEEFRLTGVDLTVML